MIYRRSSTALWIIVAAIAIAGFLLFVSHSPFAHAGGYNEGPGSWTAPADGPYDPSIGGCREYSGGMAVIPGDGQAWCTYYDDSSGDWGCFVCTPPSTPPVNHMPNAPSIGGPTTVYTNTAATYSVYATDPDGDNILYWTGFGDGVGSFQTPYVPSGTTQYGSWSWSNPGSYLISSVSYDGSLYSNWSYYTVNVIPPPAPVCTPNYSASVSTCPTSYYSDGCGNWYQGTAYCPVGTPDLTTYDGASLTGTPGVPVTFSNVIQNIGSASTGASFTNTAQICDAGCASLYAERYANAGPLNPQGTQTVSGTYTFNTPGTYYYRFCADNWANTIAESNEGNNCANYATITIANPVPPAPTCTLTSSPSSISSGQVDTLTWSSTNTTSTTGSGFSTGGTPSGSTSVTPATLPQNYGLQCVGPGGTTNASPVSVGNSCAAGSLAMTMTASSSLVPSGSSVTFNWSASNVQGSSCTISGSDGYSQTVATNACSVPAGSIARTITHQTTFTITCDGTSKAVTVNVPPAFQEF